MRKTVNNFAFHSGQRIVVLLFMIISFCVINTGCDKDHPNNPEEIPEPKDIHLAIRVAVVDHLNTKDTLNIMSGNGNYKIITPKKITFYGEGETDYSNSFFDFEIKENQIIVERKLSSDVALSAFFLLTDDADKKTIFVVTNPDIQGLYYFDDIDSILIPNQDFWNLP